MGSTYLWPGLCLHCIWPNLCSLPVRAAPEVSPRKPLLHNAALVHFGICRDPSFLFALRCLQLPRSPFPCCLSAALRTAIAMFDLSIFPGLPPSFLSFMQASFTFTCYFCLLLSLAKALLVAMFGPVTFYYLFGMFWDFSALSQPPDCHPALSSGCVRMSHHLSLMLIPHLLLLDTSQQ